MELKGGFLMPAKNELKEILKEIKSAKDAEAIKPRVKKSLGRISPSDLALAEQELLEEGITMQEIRQLCGPHIELMREGIGSGKPELDPHHPIQILMEEHEAILQNLKELEKVMGRVDRAKVYEQVERELKKLEEISHHLLEAESHHKREEEALFPEIEGAGVTGPPAVMRMEHEELRAKKRELRELIEGRDKIDYNLFASKLCEVGGYLVKNLGDHIFKENNILYPTALHAVAPEKWRTIKQRFDEIGYCCFTPASGEHHG
jgi:DUF438 domain-containing protein